LERADARCYGAAAADVNRIILSVLGSIERQPDPFFGAVSISVGRGY